MGSHQHPFVGGGPLDLTLSPVADGFEGPIGVVGHEDGRLFVIEQQGVVKIVQPNGTVSPTPFLDIRNRVDSSGNEEGLLGVAFHPNYAGNGYFYVNYINTTESVRRSRISRFSVSADPDVADPSSEIVLLTVEQPNSNHNAGHILFGADGYLYVPLGDGGGAGDTGDNAQNFGRLLGKISRIDVDSSTPGSADCAGLGTGRYSIPGSNPLIDGSGGTCDEIWAIGLRNPWRSSFDRQTNDLFLGDVGQGQWEEINLQPATSSGGENYGWRCYEGNHAFNLTDCAAPSAYTFPIFEYNHSNNGCSVTAGYVYRGNRYPAMFGHYLLTDYCSGIFWDLVPDGAGAWGSTRHANLQAFGYVAFGESARGELYLANANNNTIYHLRENTLQALKAATRALAAIWILKAKLGTAYAPPSASGSVFDDVAADDFAAAWIEQLSVLGITEGCGNNQYCPKQGLVKDELAKLLVRAKYGSAYVPPPATGLAFDDVGVGDFAASSIEQLANDKITVGCDASRYCPKEVVTLEVLATLLVKAFNL